jgi:hypothetical protein
MSLDLVQPAHQLVLPSLQRFGFFTEFAISALSRAVVLSKPRDRVCYYFILRERGGTVWAELRVAPPQFPDDRLQQLPGYGLELGQCYDFAAASEEFLDSVVRRATIVIPKIDGLADAVEEELASPVFSPEGMLRYARGAIAYEELRNSLESQDSRSMPGVLDVAKAVARGHQPEDHLVAACVPLVKELLPVVDALRDPAFEGKARVIGRLLAPHFYVDAVVGRH